MRTRNVKQSMQRFAAAVVSCSLLMALYTTVRTDNTPISARILRSADSSVASCRLQSPAPHSHMPISTAPSSQRKVAMRVGGHAVSQDEHLSANQDKWLSFVVLASIVVGAVLTKRAVNRWIAREEAERSMHIDGKDDFYIVFSRSTKESGHGDCFGYSGWTSDISKFDV